MTWLDRYRYQAPLSPAANVASASSQVPTCLAPVICHGRLPAPPDRRFLLLASADVVEIRSEVRDCVAV